MKFKHLTVLLVFLAGLSLSLPAAGSEFTPFSHVDKFYPGKTTYGDVLKILGKPEKSEITKVEKVGSITVGGNKIVKYPSKGIQFLIADKELKKGKKASIDSVTIYPPYKGKSPCGLFLGMKEADALKICKSKWKQTFHYKSSYIFGLKDKPQKSSFQLWFEKGKLAKMKVSRML